jgi:hypothetical protein
VFKYFNRGAENDALLMYVGYGNIATLQLRLSTRQAVARPPSCLNSTIAPETAKKRAIKLIFDHPMYDERD